MDDKKAIPPEKNLPLTNFQQCLQNIPPSTAPIMAHQPFLHC